MTETHPNEPPQHPDVPELESWPDFFARRAPQVGMVGAALVIGLVLSLVFLVTPGTSQSPLKGSALQNEAGRVIPTTTTTLPTKVQVQTPVTSALSSVTPDTTATTVKPPAQVPSVSIAAVAPLGPCNALDVSITTTSDASSYAAGAPVTVTSKLVDKVACIFDPRPTGEYGCPTTVVITNSAGAQVYPVPNQGEQCAPLESGRLNPGSTRTVIFDWPQQVPGPNGGAVQAPTAQYVGVAIWDWGSNASSDFENVDSPPFTVGAVPSADASSESQLPDTPSVVFDQRSPLFPHLGATG